MMKRKAVTWPILFILFSGFWAVETPLTLLFTTGPAAWLMTINTLLSAFFLWDIYQSRHSEEGEKRSALWTSFLILASLPYDLVYLTGIGPLKFFTLLKVVHIASVGRIYREMNQLTDNPKPFRLLLIGTGALVGVHLVAMSWLAINPTPELTPVQSYVKAFYWAVTTLTTTGYGDITPTTDLGRIFNVFIMLIGFSAFGIIVGNISNLIMVKNRHEEANKERMEDLSLFMQYYEIPRELRGQVFSFYAHRMKKRLSGNDAQIISDLPHALQNELQVYMKMKLIDNLPIFNGISKPCLMKVAMALESISFAGGDLVIKKGEQGDEMYVIDQGEVEVLNENNDTVAILKHGQCFGEIALLTDVQRTANVQAKSYCDVYVLRKKEFAAISKVHPELEQNFRKIMNRRMPLKAA